MKWEKKGEKEKRKKKRNSLVNNKQEVMKNYNDYLHTNNCNLANTF